MRRDNFDWTRPQLWELLTTLRTVPPLQLRPVNLIVRSWSLLLCLCCCHVATLLHYIAFNDRTAPRRLLMGVAGAYHQFGAPPLPPLSSCTPNSRPTDANICKENSFKGCRFLRLFGVFLGLSCLAKELGKHSL